MNTGRIGLGSAGVTNTAALAFGGNPNTDATEKWDGTCWTTVNPLNSARQYFAGAGTSTAALAFGGTPGASALTEKYDGTSWTEVSDLATAIFELGGVGVSSSSAIAFGGATGPGPSGASNLAEAWNDPVYTIKTVTVS